MRLRGLEHRAEARVQSRISTRTLALAIQRRRGVNHGRHLLSVASLRSHLSCRGFLSRVFLRQQFPRRKSIAALLLTALCAAASAIGARGRSARHCRNRLLRAHSQGTSRLPGQAARSAYYTDRGNLSPVLPEAAADAFVADAFSRWTSISTAAVSAVRAGQLGEDVSGTNVSASGGTIMLPADILPSAVNLPVAIVYDADGAVTNALLGQGAGERQLLLQQCGLWWSGQLRRRRASAARAGRPERELRPDFAAIARPGYRLVRVLGRVLGLDWSQMNVNVFTHTPLATSADSNTESR